MKKVIVMIGCSFIGALGANFLIKQIEKKELREAIQLLREEYQKGKEK